MRASFTIYRVRSASVHERRRRTDAHHDRRARFADIVMDVALDHEVLLGGLPEAYTACPMALWLLRSRQALAADRGQRCGLLTNPSTLLGSGYRSIAHRPKHDGATPSIQLQTWPGSTDDSIVAGSLYSQHTGVQEASHGRPPDGQRRTTSTLGSTRMGEPAGRSAVADQTESIRWLRSREVSRSSPDASSARDPSTGSPVAGARRATSSGGSSTAMLTTVVVDTGRMCESISSLSLVNQVSAANNVGVIDIDMERTHSARPD